MDELLKNVLNDNSALFKQALDMMNKLEEAEDLLREWQELSWRTMPNKKIELKERTDKFLAKEGKNE